MTTLTEKTCFVIAPIGAPNSEVRKHSDTVLRHIIIKAVDPLGYQAIRADTISEPGMITDQVMQHIMEDELVIADLTDQNPNVFYELAVRHAIGKPFIHIGKKEQVIPFDVSGIRLVSYDIQDLDSAESAVEEITKQIKSWEENPPPSVQTPISMPLEFLRISQSGEANSPGLLEILPLIQQISSSTDETRDEMQQMRRMLNSGRQPMATMTQRQISQAMESESAYSFIVMINYFSPRYPAIYQLGVEAFHQTMIGNIGYGREIFHYMLELFDPTNGLAMRIPSQIIESLIDKFERLVDRVQSVRYENDDLPF